MLGRGGGYEHECWRGYASSAAGSADAVGGGAAMRRGVTATVLAGDGSGGEGVGGGNRGE